MNRQPYDRAFYDTIRPGVRASAAVVVPLLLSATRGVQRVIDVGCGEGWWGQEFADNGCQVIGVDGSYVDGSPLGDRFIPHDLRTPLPGHLAGRFDLAVCLEVGEHLPPARAESFVAELCALAPLVVWSAAIPGQGGAGHVNEQPPSFWTRLFDQHGYQMSGALRWLIWEDDRVENWYRQNLLVAARHPQLYPDLFNTPGAHPHHVVHPVLFDARRGA